MNMVIREKKLLIGRSETLIYLLTLFTLSLLIFTYARSKKRYLFHDKKYNLIKENNLKEKYQFASKLINNLTEKLSLSNNYSFKKLNKKNFSSTNKNQMNIDYVTNKKVIKMKKLIHSTTSHIKTSLKKIELSRKLNKIIIFKRYEIRQGDSLWKITKKFDVSVNVLLRYNHFKNPNLIFSGDTIKIPI